jgi:phosphate transport system permease protein
MPLLLGVYLVMAITEYGSRVVGATSFVTDVLVGVPRIVTGAFVYALWAIHFGYSGLAPSIVLATIMLPPIIRLVARHGRSAAWPQLTTLTWTAAKWIGR